MYLEVLLGCKENLLHIGEFVSNKSTMRLIRIQVISNSVIKYLRKEKLVTVVVIVDTLQEKYS